MLKLSKATIQRIVVGVMLASLILAVTFDTHVTNRPEYDGVQELAKELRLLGQPLLLFSISSLLGVIAVIIGAGLYVFERRSSRNVLLAGALLTLISYRMVRVTVYWRRSA
jgi:hypothetical protein